MKAISCLQREMILVCVQQKNVSASLRIPSEESKVFCCWLIGSLEKIIGSAKKSTGCLNREKLWTEYYQLQISTVFTEKWKSFLQTISAPTEAIFFQHLTRILFNNLLKMSFQYMKITNEKIESIP